MSIQAIFFDIGGVVLQADLEVYAVRVAELFEARPADLRREVQALVPALEKGTVDSQTFWKQVGESLWKQRLGRPAEPGACAGIWRKLMAEVARLDLNMIHLCWQLGNRLVVGALSNTIEEHVEHLTLLGTYQPFRPCVLSCRVGLRKPEPAIYKLASKQAGIAARRCLLIDDLEENVRGARSAGWQAIRFVGQGPLLEELRRLKVL